MNNTACVCTSVCVCYLVHQVFLGDLDGVLLGAVAVPLIGHVLGHQLLQDEEQQLVVVTTEGQVAGERLGEGCGGEESGWLEI